MVCSPVNAFDDTSAERVEFQFDGPHLEGKAADLPRGEVPRKGLLYDSMELVLLIL